LQWIISVVSTLDIESLLVCLKYPDWSKVLFFLTTDDVTCTSAIATTWHTLYIRKVYTEPRHCSHASTLRCVSECSSCWRQAPLATVLKLWKHMNKDATRSFPLQLPLNHSNFLQSL